MKVHVSGDRSAAGDGRVYIRHVRALRELRGVSRDASRVFHRLDPAYGPAVSDGRVRISENASRVAASGLRAAVALALPDHAHLGEPRDPSGAVFLGADVTGIDAVSDYAFGQVVGNGDLLGREHLAHASLEIEFQLDAHRSDYSADIRIPVDIPCVYAIEYLAVLVVLVVGLGSVVVIYDLGRPAGRGGQMCHDTGESGGDIGQIPCQAVGDVVKARGDCREIVEYPAYIISKSV